jgi:phosphatidylglycerol:prolipoprotein diacylglycerol transferase
MPAAGGIPIYIDPSLLILGPIMITWHGVFTAVGTLVGVWLAVKLAQAAGYTEDDVVSVAMWGIVGAIVGARLFHVIDQWDFYARDPIAILRVNEGGLAIFGSVVGGPLVGALYAWRKGLKVSRLADVAAIPMILGMGIGRIGDIINGEHHGIVAEGFPLAFTYTHPATLGELGKPIHLAVGYEMILDLAVFAVLIWLARGIERGADGKLHWGWRPRYRRDGMLFWAFIALYSAGRFFVQFYRIDTIFALGLSQAQLLSVISVIVALWGVAYLYARSARGTATSAPKAPATS